MLLQQKNAELFGNVLSLGVPLYHYFAIKIIFFSKITPVHCTVQDCTLCIFSRSPTFIKQWHLKILIIRVPK
jgi:hypothetical protein